MRRICAVCGMEATEGVSDRLRRFVPEGAKLMRAVGCPECTMTGYRGRFSIVEVLTMNPELERLIGSGATADLIAEAARANGMRSLFESGLRHVLDGHTTIEELLRVTDIPAETKSAPRAPRASPAAAPPAAPAPRPQADAAADLGMSFELLEPEAEPEAPAPRTGRGSKGATVLLVEDEDQLRRLMKELLERDGYHVAEARDGAQALDQVDRHAPDIIMLDLNLPGLDGYGVLAKLRAQPLTARIPVIVLTAKGDEDNEVRVFELGADDFLTKPFRARALSARLDAVLARRRRG
jgi:CheY-like chemotaxis protein